jgi:hypothetical protein
MFIKSSIRIIYPKAEEMRFETFVIYVGNMFNLNLCWKSTTVVAGTFVLILAITKN